MADIFNFYVYDDRSIQFALAEPIMLEDKDVTQFRFRIPKSLNGFDMSDWEWWFIFVNPQGTKYTTLLELTDDEDEPDEYSTATYTVGYGFSGIVGTVKFSIEALNVSGEEIVNEWHTKTYATAVIDTLQGLRAVIPEPDGQAASGLTQEEKELILTLFSKAAYADDDAKQSYDQLEALWRVISRLVSFNLSHVTSSNTSASVENGSRYVTTLTADTNYSINSVTVTMGGVDVTATYYNSGTITIPSVTGNIVITASAVLEVSSLSAVYTQSGTVYDTDSLDSLKSDLVVTATYPDSSTAVIDSADYTLSGTLAEGTSTVTVAYGGKTATFNVTVTHYSEPGTDWTSGVAYTVDWGEGGYELDNTTGESKTSSNVNDHVSDFLDCKGASAVIADGLYGSGVFFYDENKTFLYRQTAKTAIENPYPFSVPRNAYYCRYSVRSSSPAYSPTPYLYPTLTENTAYELNTHYVLSYEAGTEGQSRLSNKALCYGATKLQCSLFTRSWVYFYDAEKTQLSYVIRQNGTTEIEIPSGTYYLAIDPGTIGGNGNTDNSWIMFTA